MYLKGTLIILNFIVLFFITYEIYELGLPKRLEHYYVLLIPITNILTIYYLIFKHFKSNEESLFSLWLKLKKKNIKEELEK